MGLLTEIEEIDNGIENLTLMGMILDTEFLSSVYPAAQLGDFEVPEIKIVSDWVIDYFVEMGESPVKEIRSIFKAKSEYLDKNELNIISEFLKTLTKEYGKPFNTKYVLPKALDHFKKLAIIRLAKNVKMLAQRGKVEEAFQLQTEGIQQVYTATTRMKNLNSVELVDKWWWNSRKPLFKFPGDLGRYLFIKSGKLIGILGRAKVGKSFWLLEWAKEAAMNRLNVAYFSIEMDEDECSERWTQNIGALNFDEDIKETLNPVFDCLLNQKQECTWEDCPENMAIVNKEGVVDPYEDNLDHIICPMCDTCKDFQASTWFVPMKLAKPSIKEAKKAIKKFANHFGKDRVRFIDYPIGTTNVATIVNELDSLERVDHFIPDVIIIDYADILKKSTHLKEKRLQLGEIWEELSRLAKSRHALVVTATQGNRGAMNKNRLSVEDIAEDISKIMTVDMMIAINEANDFDKQSAKDTYWKRQSLEIIACRYRKFTAGLQCLCLNNRDIGQICMNSKIKFR